MNDLSTFFGSTERSKGSELLHKGVVNISSASDTDVRAFIKGSSSCRVSLTSEEFGAAAFSATCSCPQARKGNLCKHVWAVLLKLEENGSDFLNGKTEALAREKVKARGGKQEPKMIYPAPVQASLDFFSVNGFALDDLNMDALLNARKLLSRVFHPDKGGKHEEVLELNAHFDVLSGYLKN